MGPPADVEETGDASTVVADLGDDGTNDLLVSGVIRAGEMQAWFRQSCAPAGGSSAATPGGDVSLQSGAARRPVSGMGLGLAAIGRPAYITTGRDSDLPPDRSVPALRARAHGLLDLAYAHGIRYVDVARSYGRAEELLSEWLAGHPGAGDVVVASK